VNETLYSSFFRIFRKEQNYFFRGFVNNLHRFVIGKLSRHNNVFRKTPSSRSKDIASDIKFSSYPGL
jgi:hypothetical protein